MKTATPILLACPECRRDNEAERIYCHDCGARLDRSALAGHKGGKVETVEELHKRMRGMFSQRRVKVQLFVFKAIKLTLIALTAAALFVIVMPPEVPPSVKSDVLPPQINLNLETLTESRQPQAVQFSEENVNAYLANSLKQKSKKEKLNHPLVAFERAIVGFTEGNCRATIERSIFSWSIYTSGDYILRVANGKVTATPKGGGIGRMPIHPELMKYVAFLFGDAVSAMDRERKLLNKVGSIELHDKQIVITSAQ
jgi:hypothetical protein